MYHSYECSYCVNFVARIAAWPMHATILHWWQKNTDPGGGRRALAPPRAHSRPCDGLQPTDERHGGKLCAHRTAVCCSRLSCSEHAKNDLLVSPCRAKVCCLDTCAYGYGRLWSTRSASEHSTGAEPAQIDSHEWLPSACEVPTVRLGA